MMTMLSQNATRIRNHMVLPDLPAALCGRIRTGT
jgi:hypothetical protein